MRYDPLEDQISKTLHTVAQQVPVRDRLYEFESLNVARPSRRWRFSDMPAMAGAVAFVAGLALVGGVLLTLRSNTEEPSDPAVPVAITSTTTSTTNPPSNGIPPLSDYEASYGLFVEAWNKVYDTGSLIHLRQIVATESLSIYGEEACVAHIQSRERIGEEYELSWAAVPAQGPSLIELDGLAIAVDIDTPATIGWPGGQFDATWLLPPAEATSTLGNRFKRIVLLDCGDPIDGAVGLPPMTETETTEPLDHRTLFDDYQPEGVNLGDGVAYVGLVNGSQVVVFACLDDGVSLTVGPIDPPDMATLLQGAEQIARQRACLPTILGPYECLGLPSDPIACTE